MMDEKTKSVIDLLTAALGAMAERCVEAERQRDAYKEDADSWHQNFQRKDKQLLEAVEKLTEEKEEHRKTRQALQYALSSAQKGEG